MFSAAMRPEEPFTSMSFTYVQLNVASAEVRGQVGASRDAVLAQLLVMLYITHLPSNIYSGLEVIKNNRNC